MRSFILFGLLCGASFGKPVFKAEMIGSDRPVLVVTLANGQKIRSKKSIFQAEATRLSIANNVLIVSYEGGARAKWTDIHKWRLDSTNKDFVLIGRTYEIEDTVDTDDREKIDANYATEKVERTVRKKKRLCSFKSKKIYLTTYDFSEEKDDYLEALQKACPVK